MARTQVRERILVVEPDPEIADVVARQALQPLRYRVRVVGDAGAALQESVRFLPHLIIADLHLPDLSGKDLLAALSAQNSGAPIIVIADAGEERDIIQAFRLGAADFLLWPMQETEVVSAVERVLSRVREHQAKLHLAHQLEKANKELQRRVRELTTLLDLAKTMASATNSQVLFQQMVEGAMRLTEADRGWALLRRRRTKHLLLMAQKGLPRAVATRVGKPWDDGISNLVALSGEPLNIYGEPLRRFKVSRLGQAAQVVPIKVKKEVVALLAVMRKEPRPFSSDEQALLGALADYAAVALTNAQLFRALQEHVGAMQRAAKAAREGESLKNEVLQTVNHKLHTPLGAARSQVDALLKGRMGRLTPAQREAIENLRQQVAQMAEVVRSMAALPSASLAPEQWTQVNLADLARLAVARQKPAAKKKKIVLDVHVVADKAIVRGDPDQLSVVFDYLLDNAVKFTPPGGHVTVRVEHKNEAFVEVQVQDTGMGVPKEHLERIFERFHRVESPATQGLGGLGVGLAVVREIIGVHHGRVWAESEAGKGTVVKFVLPRVMQEGGS